MDGTNERGTNTNITTLLRQWRTQGNLDAFHTDPAFVLWVMGVIYTSNAASGETQTKQCTNATTAEQ